ncbi:MAG: hypothetical protein JXB39_00965 [Deltaproteobacteria bacterium]|nr:hypothetical protein [Deltaproteobacteria bacterium]
MLRAVLFAILAGSNPGWAYDRSEIPVTRWPDAFAPYQVLPEEWEARTGLGGPLEIRPRSRLPVPAPGPQVVAIVQESLYDDLQDELATWAQDLAHDGFTVAIETATGGTAQELRAHLQDLYTQGLEGALLVGDLPVAWFEVANDYHAYGYAVFPCDLEYMDLDGSWTDSDGNDIVDAHADGSGDVEPEIWVGRMVVTRSMGDAAEVLSDYFARNHAFRRGELVPDGSALVYVDDDWIWWSWEFRDEVGLGFDDPMLVDDPETTRSTDYLPHLTESYDAIAVFVHSSPEAHFFQLTGVYDVLYWTGIPPEADALFYDLFACSNANFTDYVYMAGVYALQTESGLLALGSTKTGSMLERTAYYRELGQGEAFGASFVRWWTSVAPYTIDDVWWYYGLIQVGDPTLRTSYPELSVDPPGLSAVAEGGEPAVLGLEVACSHLRTAEVRITTDAAWIEVDPSSVEVGEDPVEVTVTLDPATAPGGLTQAWLVVDAPGAVNGPLAVPVSLLNGDPSVFCVEPEAIDATAVPGGDPVSLDVVVTNCGGGALAFDVALAAPWAAVHPASGTSVGDPVTLEVTLDPTDLAAGVHEAVLSLSSTGEVAPVEIPITFLLEEGCSGCSGRQGRSGFALLAWVALGFVLCRRRAQ